MVQVNGVVIKRDTLAESRVNAIAICFPQLFYSTLNECVASMHTLRFLSKGNFKLKIVN